jgi:hypothetical protein
MRVAVPLLFLAVGELAADVSACACQASPEALETRACSLCREADKHPADAGHFFLKDNNPRKPNRWLLLPRSHDLDGANTLTKMTTAERTKLWEAAIVRAQELFGDGWGLAINGDKVRTQCHAHIHIGKLLAPDLIETEKLVVVDGPADIPAPKDGTGLWIHPAGKRLHVHLGEHTCETVLVR